jgi:anaerobic ribonucleoside-triphosphate reductase activating protein
VGVDRVALQLNKAHFPVTVLGPGRRIGIWLQGCSIGCAGCVSRDTWPTDTGRTISVAQLLAWCREVSRGELDGVTISGGEPFEQPTALAALLRGLHGWRASLSSDFDLLCYSGYPLRTLRKGHGGILDLLDAIIPEPFVETLPLGGIWRGSSNQPLVALSERGRSRYAAFSERPASDAAKRLQVAVEKDRIWYIGIPDRGDMARLEAASRERGLHFAKTSWR